MDLKDSIKQLSDRIEKLKENLLTEEATKNALIMPFLQALGYDVFNPLEVVPEFTCDIGTKKGEKIDYAIFKDGKPVILMECKHWQQDLNLHDNQLLRYFTVSNSKFGILTNGIIYRFYTDLEKTNKMDEKPFLEVNLTDIKANQIDELKKFHKTYFDVDNILSSASELKYMGELKIVLSNEFSNPTPEFVKLLAKQVYDGQFTAKIIEQFTGLVKRSIANQINDTISDRLKTALKAESETTGDKEQSEKTIQDNSKKELPEGVIWMSEDGSIVTTQEEMEGFYIVKAILRKYIEQERIVHRDFQKFFSILIDDTNRQCPCRLYFNNPNKKQIEIQNEDKTYTKYDIKKIDDIYNYSDLLESSAKKYSKKE